MLWSVDQSDNAFHSSIVQCRPFLKMQQKFQLSLNSMALHPDYLPLCFSSIGMYEDFLIAITQFNKCVVVYWTRNNIWSFQWVRIMMYWMKLSAVLSDSDYKTYVKLERVTTIERYEWCPSILLWINNGNITSRNHQVPIFSNIEIVFFLFQTALRYHQWSEWLWTWYLQCSQTHDLFLRCGFNDEFRKWKSKSWITSFVMEMFWKMIKIWR